MAFPVDPLQARVELLLGGSWVDVSIPTLHTKPITVKRGFDSEETSLSPSKCSLTFNNTSGDFTPWNIDGAYYGQIGRNTPVRVGIVRSDSYLLLDGYGSYVSTPDSAALSSPSVSVRVELSTDDLGSDQVLAEKWGSVGNYSWSFMIISGKPTFYITLDGTSIYTFPFTERFLAPPTGRIALRLDYDASDGHARAYRSDSLTGSWEFLQGLSYGTSMPIYDGTADVVIGQRRVLGTEDDGTYSEHRSMVYGAQLTDLSSDVAVVDIGPVTAGAGSFVDAQGNTWTLQGDAEVTDVDWVFHGEIPAWPVERDLSGTYAETTVEASGLLRRLQQGAYPVVSAIRRAATVGADDSNVLAYWPCEDGKSTTRISAVKGVSASFDGAPNFQGCTSFDCSDPLPFFNYAEFTGNIPFYTATQNATIRCLLSIPSGGLVNGGTLLYASFSGAISGVRVAYGTGGNLVISAYDNNGALIDTGTLIAFGIDGKDIQFGLEVEQTGASTVTTVMSVYVVGDAAGYYDTKTFTGTIYRILKVQINRGKGMGVDLGLGHVIVRKDLPSRWNLLSAISAHTGLRPETPITRFKRLCYENDVPYRVATRGDTDNVTMGAQQSDTLVTLLNDVSSAENGLITDDDWPKIGLKFRSRSSMYGQGPALTLDYTSDAITAFKPVPDDLDIVNDVTVSRRDGGSARSVLDTGSLSVLPYPNGIGRYPKSEEFSLGSDTMCGPYADWLLHAGTWDEPRYPTFQVLGEKLSSAQLAAVANVRVGDLIAVKNVPDMIDDVHLLVLGVEQTIEMYSRVFTFNTVPGRPWNVGTYNVSRYGTDSSTITANLDTTATAFDVASVSVVWTTTVGSFPFDIRVGPEVMTVTGITGVTSPQTFTVTRSVNGVVRSHTSGDNVTLAHDSFYGM